MRDLRKHRPCRPAFDAAGTKQGERAHAPLARHVHNPPEGALRTMPTNLLARKADAFVLWRLENVTPPPALIIGELEPGAPIRLLDQKRFPLQRAAGFTDLWEIPAALCQLTDGKINHYWFEVAAIRGTTRITDPTAYMVDWRLIDPDSSAPASVIQFRAGLLQPADPGGDVGDANETASLSTLPPNNRLVISRRRPVPRRSRRQCDRTLAPCRQQLQSPVGLRNHELHGGGFRLRLAAHLFVPG